MTLLEMSYLSAIARHGNLTKAAQELFVTQPTLTKFLQNQEEHYGVPFFKRNSNRYELTYAGKTALEHANRILQLSRSMEMEMSEMKKSDIDNITVGFTNMRIALTIPSVLPVFRAIYPNVNVHIIVDTTSTLEKMILDGRVDIAFYNTSAYSKSICYEKICREEILLAAPPRHPIAQEAVAINDCAYPWVDLCKLKDETFILRQSGSRTNQFSQQLCLQSGFFPNVMLELENVVACIGLVSTGYGFSFISEGLLPILPKLNENPEYFAVGAPRLVVYYIVAYRNENCINEHIRTFINVMKKSFNKKEASLLF